MINIDTSRDDWFISFVRNFILASKERTSRQIFQGNYGRAALPKLGQAGTDGGISLQTIQAINTQLGKLRYVSDPNMGTFDFYNPGHYTQLILNNSNPGNWPCDCDDYAVYGVDLARECGINRAFAKVLNLLIHPGQQITHMKWNHVLCGIEFWDGSRKKWTAILDTNSAANGQILYVPGAFAEREQDILNHFNNIYRSEGVNYYRVIEVKHPFD